MGKEAKEHIQEVIEKLKIAKEIATDNVTRRQEKNKQHYDKKAKEPDFRVGQKVLIRVYKVPPGLSRKLQDNSDGPYLITQLGPNHTYRLMNSNTRKVMKSLINAQHLRIYHDPRIFRRQDDIIVTPQNSDEENDDHQPNADNADTVNNEVDKEIVDETTYEVECLLGKKTMNGVVHYKCKWKDGSTPTWEPIDNIAENLIEDYHIKYTQQGKRRKRKGNQNYQYFNQSQD
ncbi:uncharacterized protein LOC134719390 [Mytilus trossulus]|uniref:uncharacterized protein LOC134719390 n=1 Tax=Mytilus trossulus TaxID=6551 RepID=UPI003006E646